MSATKVFGREMVRQSTPGELYVLELGAYDSVTLYLRRPGRWFITGPGVSEHASGADEACRVFERKAKELLESLGPLVGWAPLEKP